MSSHQQALINQVETFSARNYAPLPVVIAEGEGAWVTDVDGRRFLDCLAAYSAVNFGHRHPKLVEATIAQLGRLTLTSRAFYSEPFGPFVEALADLCGKDLVLPMNTGVEAVETAIKAARKWGYQVKGVPEGKANIIVMDRGFHGRTTTVISFSTDPVARADYAPYTPGFRSVPYGDAAAIAAAMDDHTVAVLLEPIQGEAGVIIPPEGYLTAVRKLCTTNSALMIADEIQSGLGRTGHTFACQREDVVPDIYCLGKALGGGILPLSAVVADRDILGVFTPGTHGSTFGGNPLACAVGSAVLELVSTGKYQAASKRLGARLLDGLTPLVDTGILTEIRGAGLWLGLDVSPDWGTALDACTALMCRGILAKDTHTHTVRFAPPLVVTEDEVDLIIETTASVMRGNA